MLWHIARWINIRIDGSPNPMQAILVKNGATLATHTLAVEERCQLLALPVPALRAWVEAFAPPILRRVGKARACELWRMVRAAFRQSE
eukprot:tig00000139_g8301.t1